MPTRAPEGLSEPDRRPADVRAAALAATASLFGLGVVVLAGLGPREAGSAAAIFPPWWSQARVIEAAASAGDIVSRGGAGDVVLVRGDPATLRTRLRAAGALLLLDPQTAGLCAPPRSPNP